MMIRKDNLLELLHSSRLIKILKFINKFIERVEWTVLHMMKSI